MYVRQGRAWTDVQGRSDDGLAPKNATAIRALSSRSGLRGFEFELTCFFGEVSEEPRPWTSKRKTPGCFRPATFFLSRLFARHAIAQPLPFSISASDGEHQLSSPGLLAALCLAFEQVKQAVA